MTRLKGSVGMRRQRSGSAFVETLIALPLMYLIGGGVVQWGFIYEAKSTLNYATFMAARSGTVNKAREAPMRRAFARAMVPLYSPEKSITGLTRTLAQTTVDAFNPLITRLRILNPTTEAFDDFGKDLDEDGAADDLRNSRLWQASTRVGSASGVNIQDANLLKLEVVYRYEMKIPFVGPIIAAVADAFTADEDWTVETKGRLQGRRDRTPRIPILATATVRMQSEAERNKLMVSREDLDDAFESESNVAGPVEIPPEPPRPSNPTPGDGGEVNFITNDPPSLAGGGGDVERIDDEGDPQQCLREGNAQGSDPASLSSQGEVTSQSSSLPSLDVGNPINVVTGNKYQREVDFGPLPGELSLAFVRHYNSRNRNDSETGFGWRHSYAARLTPPAERGNPIRLTQADGRKLVFQSDDGRHYRARRPGEGTLEIIRRNRREEYHWRWQNGRTLVFDQRGRLSGIKAPAADAEARLLYNADDRLWRVVDPQGRFLSLSYYPRGRLKAIFGPEQEKTSYRYDESGNLTEVTYSDETTRVYHYEDPNDPHNLTGLTDQRGVRLATWAYDENDRAILSTHAGDVGKVTLDFGKGETNVTDSQGRQSIYHTEIRDGIPLVTGIDGPGCSTCGIGDMRYAYNARHQLTEETTKDGITLRYHYDDLGRTTGVSREAPGKEPHWLVVYEYQGTSPRPSHIQRPGVNPDGAHGVALTYNPNQQLTELAEYGYAPTPDGSYAPIERQIRLAYEGPRLIEIDGPREDVDDIIRLSYESGKYTNDRRLQTIALPDGTTQKVLAYDKFGRPTKVQRGEQTPTEVRYNRRGQPETVSRGQRTITYAYTPTGKLESITDPDGNTTTLAYDTADRASRVTNADGHVLNVELDTEGKLIRGRLNSQSGELLRTISYLYDAEGRLSAVQGTDGTPVAQYGYDEKGRPNQLTDSEGNTTEMSYGPLGQLLSLTQPGDVVTDYHYDDNGQFTGLTDARDNTTEYVRDDFGNTLEVSSPDTGITRYAYDAAGNRVTKQDAEGNTTTYRYNAANRLVERTTADGVVSLGYDQGQLTEMQGPDAQETFAYDTDGQLTKHTRFIDGHEFTTAYVYNDITGKLTEKHLPDGQVLNYHYHTNGKLRAITRNDIIGRTTLVGELNTQADSLTHKRRVYGNGIATGYDYDNTGRLTRLTTTHVQRLDYTYDAQDNITGITRDFGFERYGYDTLGRLTEADTPVGSFQYQYDKLGNRTGKTENGQTSTYTYSAEGQGNRLDAVSREGGDRVEDDALTYNRTGSPTQSGHRSYDYNADQRPTKLYIDGNLKAEYAYNGWGERIKKVVYSGNQKKVTYYFYDGRRLTGEANEDGDITAQYVYYKNQPVAKLEGSDLYAIHTDHLGTPRAATDEDGELVWQAEYTPFGKATVTTEQITLNLRFPGQYEDQESGTHYNYFRDYDPETGRYLTSDPIGINGGLNLFAYADTNPLSAIDPLGLFATGDSLSDADIQRLDGNPAAIDAFVNSELTTFKDRENFYNWTDQQLNSKPEATQTDWFRGAAQVNEDDALGAVDSNRLSILVFGPSTIDYLRYAGIELAKQNVQTFLTLIQGGMVPGIPCTTQGDDLDLALVTYEQNRLEVITDDYFRNVRNNLPLRTLVIDDLNDFMNGRGVAGNITEFTPFGDETTERIIKEEFTDKGREFDIGNKAHRIELGEEIIKKNNRELGR